MKSAALLATCLAMPLLATAGVNPSNGDFFITYRDIAQQAGSHDLNLERTYNSLASELGWFGYGWGSAYETRLVAMPDGSAAVQENGSGQINFYRAGKKADIQGGITRIIEAATQREQLTPEAAAALRQKLAANEELRMRKVLQYGLQADLPAQTLLRSNACGAAAITRVADSYRRTGCDGNHDYFDLQGRLIRREESDGYSVYVQYENTRPSNIRDTLGLSIALKWSPAGLLADASTSKDHILYTYDQNQDLVIADDVNGLRYDYDYDRNHNLTRIGYVDKTSMHIEYKPTANGVVQSVTQRLGEKTAYEYRSDPADAGHTWTKVTAFSETGKPVSREYEYRRRITDTGAEQLAEFTAGSSHNRQQTTFDEKGRVIRKANAEGGYSEYVYHPRSDKIILVLSNNLQTSFHYDQQGNLLRAENSKGRVIDLEYGGTQQIQRMIDTDRKARTRHDVSFKYNAAGKPVEITLAGSGKIYVSYDDKGEISKVSSPKGAKMALKITQIFQDLLTVVRVAGPRIE